MSEERNDVREEQKRTDEKYMKEAIRQAKKAYKLDETPIGCVIVHEGRIIGRGYNRRNTDKSPLAHAEITAIKKASKKIGDWRLEECTLYVTLEPCQMCAGAIIQSRVTRVVVGCMNPKAGVCRISPEPAGRESVQSSGGAYHRSARRRVQRDDDRVLPGASGNGRRCRRRLLCRSVRTAAQ